jgi:hypothetical protein
MSDCNHAPSTPVLAVNAGTPRLWRGGPSPGFDPGLYAGPLPGLEPWLHVSMLTAIGRLSQIRRQGEPNTALAAGHPLSILKLLCSFGKEGAFFSPGDCYLSRMRFSVGLSNTSSVLNINTCKGAQ